MLNSDIQEKILKIVTLWNKTEAIVKKAEILKGQIIAPSVNELRYAGRCLIDILSQILAENPNHKEIDALLHEVEKNCEKAHNDCVDAIVLALRKKMELLESKFTRVNIAKYITTYTKTNELLCEADEYIINSRKERTMRTKTYDLIVLKHIDDIIVCLKSIEANENLLLDEAEKDIRDKKLLKYGKWAVYSAILIAIFDKIYPYIPKFW